MKTICSRFALLVLLTGTLALQNRAAGAGLTIPLAAKLTDANGLVIHGTNVITYRLYLATEGGEPVWTERQTNAVQLGVLSTQLGSVTSLVGANLEDDAYLGVAVGNDSEMQPRIRIPGQRFGVPRGGIIMWSGSKVPDGWSLCDGTQGTPNLSGRFIVASGTNAETGTVYSVGDVGGKEAHTHGGETAGHALLPSEMPKHRHTTFSDDDPKAGRFLYFGGEGAWKAVGGGGSNGDGWTPQTGDAGGDQPHSHRISADKNVPPFYALAFIMKR